EGSNKPKTDLRRANGCDRGVAEISSSSRIRDPDEPRDLDVAFIPRVGAEEQLVHRHIDGSLVLHEMRVAQSSKIRNPHTRGADRIEVGISARSDRSDAKNSGQLLVLTRDDHRAVAFPPTEWHLADFASDRDEGSDLAHPRELCREIRFGTPEVQIAF